MLLSQRLERLANDYDDARRTVSLFLLDNAERVPDMSMAEVAASTYTSKATLVRVAKQLGFSGWTELSRAYAAELIRQQEHATNVDHSLPFAAGSPAREIMTSLCQLRAETAWRTAQIQDAAAVERAANILACSRKIGLFGVSVNALLLALFQRKCMTIGVDAVQPPQAEFGIFARTLTAEDCALMVSYTGESEYRAPMKRIPLLRANGVKIISITGEGDNYLRANSDVNLTILSCESLYAKIGTFSTEESVSCVLDMLYGCLFAKNYESNLRFKTETSRMVELNRRPGAPE